MNNEGIENRTIVTNFIIAQAITTKIFKFTDRIFRRYLHYHSVGKKITDEITDGKSSSVNLLLVIFYPSVILLVIKNNITDGFTDGKSEQKKIFHFVSNFLGNKPFVIPSVII
jgi:archaellum biogenesis protein FlaJ (TadC family)